MPDSLCKTVLYSTDIPVQPVRWVDCISQVVLKVKGRSVSHVSVCVTTNSLNEMQRVQRDLAIYSVFVCLWVLSSLCFLWRKVKCICGYPWSRNSSVWESALFCSLQPSWDSCHANWGKRSTTRSTDMWCSLSMCTYCCLSVSLKHFICLTVLQFTFYARDTLPPAKRETTEIIIPSKACIPALSQVKFLQRENIHGKTGVY